MIHTFKIAYDETGVRWSEEPDRPIQWWVFIWKRFFSSVFVFALTRFRLECVIFPLFALNVLFCVALIYVMCLLALRSIGGMAFNTHSWNCIRYFPPIQMKIITLRSSLHLQAKCGFFPNAFAGWLLIVQLPAFFLCSESRYVYALWMCERFSLPNSMVRWHKQLKLFFVFVSVLKCSHCWYFYSYLVALNFLVYKNKRKKSKRNYRFHFSWYRFCIQTKIGFSQTKKLFILQR